MASNFPGALDDFPDFTALTQNDTLDGGGASVVHTDEHQRVADAIVSLEAFLNEGNFTTNALVQELGGELRSVPGVTHNGDTLLLTQQDINEPLLTLRQDASYAADYAMAFEASDAASRGGISNGFDRLDLYSSPTDEIYSLEATDGAWYANKSLATTRYLESNLLAGGKALVSGAGDYITAVVESTTTATQIGYLDTLTSNVQTQINGKQPLDADITTIGALTGTGFPARTTTSSTWALRTITAGTGVAVINGAGIAGNPLISIGQAVGTASNVTFNSVTAAAMTSDTVIANTYLYGAYLYVNDPGFPSEAYFSGTELGVYDAVVDNITPLSISDSFWRFTGGVTINANAAPADASLATGEMALWFDSTSGSAKLKIKAKNASGTVVTGEVALT